MEALSLSSPIIVCVVGLPGSGKSFFANQFANTFGAAIVSRDRIRWTLFAHHTYSDNENAIVDQVSEIMISELLRTQKTFILDGGYDSEQSRRQLAIRAHKNGYRLLTIAVQTDEPTCRRRATKRSDKKEGDEYKQSLSNEQFDEAKKLYNEPDTTKPDVVVISGKHTYKTQARMVLKKMVDSAKTDDHTVKVNNLSTQPRATLNIKPRGPFVR